MEYEGVKINTEALAEMSKELDEESRRTQDDIFQIAGVEFNIASPKQLGEILFEQMKIVDKPKKTNKPGKRSSTYRLSTNGGLYRTIELEQSQFAKHSNQNG